jgi:molybdate transport repressor ModE-like protein
MGRKKKLELGPYRVKVSIRIFENEKTGAGEVCSGVVQLLQGIVDHGSLYQAARHMGMARSKACRLIDDCERGLGYPLAIGNSSRGSILTPEGKKLMMMHQTLQAEFDKQINARLRELLR